MDNAKADDDAKEEGSSEEMARSWLGEIAEAYEREKTWRKLSREIIAIYEAEEGSEVPFNILYSNTETMAPAVYNQAPKPDTRPRSRGKKSATAQAAAGVVDGYLTHFIDTNDPRFSSFDECMRTAVHQALLPNRGTIRLYYRANVERDAESKPTAVKDEVVFSEVVDWDKILFGYAKTWEAVPWIAFEHNFTREEAERELGEEKANLLTYCAPEVEEGEKKKAGEGDVKVATLYEIWDKIEGKVRWVERDGKMMLKEGDPDPYKLHGFYPMAKPLQFFRRLSSMVPKPLYQLYRKQAQELNKLTTRIDKITEGMKIRGFYDQSVDGLEKALELDDNQLLPLQTPVATGTGSKAEAAIYLFPIEKHITVLRELIAARESVKRTIYEILGLGDIMRGVSAASETLGAQEIKDRWGTQRLKRQQAEVGRYVRDTLRLAAELAFSKIGPDTLYELTGSSLPREADMAPVEAQLMMAQQSGQQVPPQLAQMAAIPTFEDCLEVLKSDLHRKYAVDIETNSTIDADVMEDKKELGEFLNALAQFFNGLMPLIESGAMPMPLVLKLLGTLSHRFKLGSDFDQAFQEALANGGGQQGGGADAKKQIEQAQKQIQQAQQQLEAEKAKVKSESDAVEKAKNDLERSKMDFELSQAMAEAQRTIQEAQVAVKDAKQKAALEMILVRIQTASAKAAAAAKPKEKKDAPV